MGTVRNSDESNQPMPLTSGTQDYDKWRAKEEEFHLEQAVLRSKIRISNNREKPIDHLAKVILIIEGKLETTQDFLSP